MVQPSIWKRASEVDQEMRRGRKEKEYYGRYANSGKNGYKGVSRIHLRKVRDSLSARQSKICWGKKQRAISEYDCCFQRRVECNQ